MSLKAKRGPESVSLLLWDGRRVLLTRRDLRRGLFPSTWTLPGRELARGEAAEVAALDVLRTAAGLDSSHIRLLRRLRQPSPFRDERGRDSVYQVLTWEGEAPLGEKLAWFEPEALRDVRIFREARDTLVALCATLPGIDAVEVAR
jgi:ADP-ribose pyrophosphatase YjhB (NUDIX family)